MQIIQAIQLLKEISNPMNLEGIKCIVMQLTHQIQIEIQNCNLFIDHLLRHTDPFTLNSKSDYDFLKRRDVSEGKDFLLGFGLISLSSSKGLVYLVSWVVIF